MSTAGGLPVVCNYRKSGNFHQNNFAHGWRMKIFWHEIISFQNVTWKFPDLWYYITHVANLPCSTFTGCRHHRCCSSIPTQQNVHLVGSCLHGRCHGWPHMAKLRMLGMYVQYIQSPWCQPVYVAMRQSSKGTLTPRMTHSSSKVSIDNTCKATIMVL